ncbi:helix-turn-helix domain-containing protein [Paenibacillus sp. 2TAB19]|uniref:helix-turn-helix domain-containing protein n=1 Tax=Paenibacillus sp. 2TAB19 TaxID=3233003 RepID=UPI003F97853B
MLKLKLAEIILKKGTNARQLSQATGIRWNTIDDMINNQSKTWSPTNLEKVMISLGIEDVSELIEYVKEEASDQ